MPHLVWVYTQALGSQLDAATWLATTRELRRLGWQVTLVTADRRGTTQLQGVEVLALPKGNAYALGHLPFHAAATRWILGHWSQIDVVLFHHMSAPWLLPLRLLRVAARAGPRLVMDSRTLAMAAGETAWKDRGRRALYTAASRLSNRLADGRTAITRRLAEAEAIPPGRLWGTWSSGVDLHSFRLARQQRVWPSGDDAIHLVYAGGLSYERNLAAMIRAVGAVATQGFDYRLSLLGDGAARADLEQEALGAQGRVTIVGPVPREEVPHYLAQAHVGVLPFPDLLKFRVSSPIKLFEYMGAGLPVLATRITCHTDVVGDADYVIWAEDSSVDGLRQALVALWRRRAELQAMGRQAAESSLAWTWERSARRLDAALRRGLGLPDGGPDADSEEAPALAGQRPGSVTMNSRPPPWHPGGSD